MNNNELSVYGDVPGLNPSPFYQMKVKKEGSERYLHPFTFVTECTTEKYCNTTGIFNHLANWSNSYINFEMQDGVDVEIVITKLFGDPIQKAVVHPYTASKNCVVRNGKAYVTINKTGLFTGKSFSEELILASTNPQYDKRLFIELQVQHMKIPCLEHGKNMLCT